MLPIRSQCLAPKNPISNCGIRCIPKAALNGAICAVVYRNTLLLCSSEDRILVSDVRCHHDATYDMTLLHVWTKGSLRLYRRYTLESRAVAR
jgi:hypothetical protein